MVHYYGCIPVDLGKQMVQNGYFLTNLGLKMCVFLIICKTHFFT